MIDAKTLADATKAYGVILSGTATEAELIHADNAIDRMAERCGVTRSEIAEAVENQTSDETSSTESIRREVRQAAPSPNAVWPNGLGYTWRGWEYHCRKAGSWTAIRGDKLGQGETPTVAKSNAVDFGQ